MKLKARDTVQQIFLKVINELPKYKVTYFKSWIYMVAKNTCLMQLRNKYSIVDIESNELIQTEPDLDTIRAKEIDYNLLELAINELNDEQKAVSICFIYKKVLQRNCGSH